MVADFIERKHGRRKIESLHPALEPILRDTYGVILYQEQVMRIASELAGFTLGQADLLRKAMGKKKKEVMEAQRSRFLDGAAARGVKRPVAAMIWEQIEHFAGYGFNKSHSVAYAIVSVHTAYLKANYPAEYLAASLSSEIEDTSRMVVLIEDCRRRGVEVLPPDVNTSAADFRVRDGKVAVGLLAVKNVGAGTVEAILAERDRSGPFRSLFDFCERVESRAWNRRVLESLVQAGALDALPGHRAQKLAGLDQAIEHAQRVQGERARGQTSLFGDAAAGATLALQLPLVPEWEVPERLQREKQALGFYLSGHPLDAHAPLLRDVAPRSTLDLQESDDGTQAVLAGSVTSRKVIFDKKGKPMAFVKLEDFVGAAEVVLFSDAYQRYESLLVEDAVVVACGRTSAREDEQTKLLCDTVLTPEQAVATLGRALHLVLDAAAISRADLDRLRGLLAARPGPCEVYLRLLTPSRAVWMRSRNTRVAPSPQLLDDLRSLLGPEHVRLVCAAPPPARTSPGRPAGGGRPDAASRGVDRPRAVP
jgi:DNA polymerase-3 subunit alpha